MSINKWVYRGISGLYRGITVHFGNEKTTTIMVAAFPNLKMEAYLLNKQFLCVYLMLGIVHFYNINTRSKH